MKKTSWSSFFVAAVMLIIEAAAEEQHPTKIPRIGYLSATLAFAAPLRTEAFRQSLRDGYVEGKNIVIEYRYAEGKLDRLPALAAELVRLKVVIVTGGSSPTRAAKEATNTIPIVMAQPFSQRTQLADLALKNRLPAMYYASDYVDDGGLMSYGFSGTDLYRRAATYVDKILKGRMSAELPVEQPKKFEFIINLKAAKQIGLTIPSNVLARADRVIR